MDVILSRSPPKRTIYHGCQTRLMTLICTRHIFHSYAASQGGKKKKQNVFFFVYVVCIQRQNEQRTGRLKWVSFSSLTETVENFAVSKNYTLTLKKMYFITFHHFPMIMKSYFYFQTHAFFCFHLSIIPLCLVISKRKITHHGRKLSLGHFHRTI